MDYLKRSIKNIHLALLNNEVTPLDLVEASLLRANNDDNNAFEYICEKEAVEQAKGLDKSKISSFLYGIPVVIKDNFSTKDILTTGSSEMLKDYVPIFSSEVASRLEKAGAIIVGKTTLDELAMGGNGTNTHKGISTNPWDKNRIVGGSSCGSAIAVSKGIAPISIGSDTGDSVRKPANYCGLVGFKPTWGRISRFGLFPFATSLDHVGYFTRNVFDSALLLNVLAGRDDKDASSSFKKIEDYTLHLDDSIKGKHIAVINQVIDSVKDKNIINAFNQSIAHLRDLGAEVDYIDIDEKILKVIYPTYLIVSSAEATSNNANLDGIKFGSRQEGSTYEEMVINTRTKCFSSHVKKRFALGSYALLKENQEDLFVKAMKYRRLIVNTFNGLFEKYDAIYCPSSSSIAPRIDEVSGDLYRNLPTVDRFMTFANLGGYPSINIPIGMSENLPFGALLTAKPFEESKLLNIASKIEEDTGLKDLVSE